MEFHNYTTMYQALKEKGETVESYYGYLIQEMGPLTHNSYDARVACHQCNDEREWYRLKQPYYNVWPGIAKMLCRLDLGAVNPKEIDLPLSTLLFRLAKDKKSISFGDYEVQTVLANSYNHTDEQGNPKERWMCFWIDFGEKDEHFHKYPVLTYRQLNMELATVEESFQKLETDSSVNIGVKVTDTVIKDVVRMVLSCCLLSHNAADELINPLVLNDDIEKYNQTKDYKYIEKAIRRGKYGFDVGRLIELSPHYRQPHLALFWTGEGRTKPVIKMRRGAIIHKQIVDTIPTGYTDDE